MKTLNVLKMAFGITVLALTIACSKKNDTPTPNPADSRTVKYEITGNATGTFDATYITGSGTGANEIPASLPWSKEIVAQSGVTGVLINAAVSGAIAGKTITAKIYVGGVEKKSQSATVQSNGTAVIGGLSYILK